MTAFNPKQTFGGHERKAGFQPARSLQGWLPGFELAFSPLVNFKPKVGSGVFGLLLGNRDSLGRVMANFRHAILPHPVLGMTRKVDQSRLSLLHRANMEPGSADHQ